MIISGQFIVLDKRPYRESALLLRGLSPDYGRISLVLHSGQTLSGNSFPEADLFREIEVEFEDDGKGKDLFTARNVSMLTDFSSLAETPKHFLMAGKIGAFLLNNVAPGVPQPYTYDSLRSVLSNLAGCAAEHEPWTLEQCAVVVKTAFLYENGLLPEAQQAAQNDFLENLVASGIDDSPLPECRPEYWSSLNSWLNRLMEFHQLKR